MRTMLRVSVDTEMGNKAVRDGTIERLINDTIERIKPEAAYFCSDRGVRTAYFVFDLQDTSQMPPIAEPLFMQLGAAIEVIPVMNADELKAGLGRLSRR